MTSGQTSHGNRVLDHVGVAVSSFDEATAVLTTLGLHPEGPDEVVAAFNTVVRCFRVGDALIEFVSPLDDATPLHDFLSSHGPGLHHLALRVDDLDAEIARLDREGVQLINREPAAGRAGSRVAFLIPDPHTGTLIELVEHKGHGRRG